MSLTYTATNKEGGTFSGSLDTAAILAADARAGYMYAVNITLSATPNTIQQINIPTGSKGFRIYCATADVQYNIDADPVSPIATASAGGALTLNSSHVGNSALAGIVETRLIESTAAKLHIASATASAVVRVGFF